MCATAGSFIWRLNGSLKEAQCMVNEIYSGVPVLNKIVDKCSKKPTSVSWLFYSNSHLWKPRCLMGNFKNSVTIFYDPPVSFLSEHMVQ